MPGTSTPPKIGLPGADSQSELRDLKLNNEWRIGEPVPKANERHAAVYSVLISETGQSADNLEAHVFSLDGIEPKLRKYRQRCIKRMKGRTELEAKVDGLTVVIITTSQRMSTGGLERRSESRYMRDGGQLERDGGTVSPGEVKQKTPWQVELHRIRQQERRRAKRCQRTRQPNQRAAEKEHGTFERVRELRFLRGKNQILMLVALLLELLNSSDLSAAIPPKYKRLVENIESGYLHETLDKFLLHTANNLGTVEEMQLFLKERRSEVIELRRHQAKILCLEKDLARLVDMRRVQAQDTEDSDLLGEKRLGLEAEVKDKVKLVKSANDIINKSLLLRKSIVWSVGLKLWIAGVETSSNGA